MGNLLEGCGRYSEKLIEISATIKKQKIFNGEQITQKDILDIDEEVYEAYQAILSNAKDGNTISLAIQNMANIVEKNGNVNMKNVATSSIKMAVEQTKGKSFEHEDNTDTAETTAFEISQIMTDSNSKESVLDLVFTQDVREEIDTTLESAKNGDEKSTEELKTIQGAAKFLETFDVIDEKLARGALGWMRRLAILDSKVAKELLEQYAKKYGFDIYEVDENGKNIISTEKIERLFEEKVSNVNPEAARMTNEDFKKIGLRVAKNSIEKGEFTREEASGMTADLMITEIKNNSRVMKARREVRLAFEKAEPTESLQSIANKYPEETVQILKEKIDISTRLIEKGRKAGQIENLQREIMLLGDVVSAKGKENIGMDNTQESNMKNETPDGTKKTISEDYIR